jgi:hypothetical protein
MFPHTQGIDGEAISAPRYVLSSVADITISEASYSRLMPAALRGRRNDPR